MTRTHLGIVAVALFLVLALPAPRAAAQAPPFFNGAPTIFDPEIGVVQSGILEDVQATVSADRKYVTMTTRFQQADLIAIREFAFQVGNGGAAGAAGGAAGGVGAGAAAANAASGAAGGAARGTAATANARDHAVPTKPYPTPGKASTPAVPSVLEKTGTTLVGRVQPRPDNKTPES